MRCLIRGGPAHKHVTEHGGYCMWSSRRPGGCVINFITEGGPQNDGEPGGGRGQTRTEDRTWGQTTEHMVNLGTDYRTWGQTTEPGDRLQNLGTDYRTWGQTTEPGDRLQNLGTDYRIWGQTTESGDRLQNTW